jgi:hypothetical protein
MKHTAQGNDSTLPAGSPKNAQPHVSDLKVHRKIVAQKIETGVELHEEIVASLVLETFADMVHQRLQ